MADELRENCRQRIQALRDRLAVFTKSKQFMSEEECDSIMKEALEVDAVAAVMGYPRMPSELKDKIQSGEFKKIWARSSDQ